LATVEAAATAGAAALARRARSLTVPVAGVSMDAEATEAVGAATYADGLATSLAPMDRSQPQVCR